MDRGGKLGPDVKQRGCEGDFSAHHHGHPGWEEQVLCSTTVVQRAEGLEHWLVLRVGYCDHVLHLGLGDGSCVCIYL